MFTGSKMIVWGFAGQHPTNSGGVYLRRPFVPGNAAASSRSPPDGFAFTAPVAAALLKVQKPALSDALRRVRRRGSVPLRLCSERACGGAPVRVPFSMPVPLCYSG